MVKKTNINDVITSILNARKNIESIMGKGKVICEVFEIVEQYANQDCPLLFEGETGVGKKEIIKYLHSISPRAEKELITIDCSAFVETLIESELFGVRKGAYTDAKEDRKGRIEAANGSTLFIDEINSLPKHLLPKLLRVIQEKEITKVGDNKPIKIDVRIVAASNEKFQDLLKNKRFRRDLYERFVEVIKIPNLQDRKEDFDFFINKFIEEKTTELNKKIRISSEAKKLLKSYTYEGNIRQFINVIHKLVTHAKQEKKGNIYIINSAMVKKCLSKEIITKKEDEFDDDFTWETALNVARKNAIERALKEANGNNEKAIGLLHISRRTYYEWKKDLNDHCE